MRLASGKGLGDSPAFNRSYVDESLLDVHESHGKEKKSFVPSPPVFHRPHSSATTTPIRKEKGRRPSVEDSKVAMACFVDSVVY